MGESEEIICVVKEDKDVLKVFRISNLEETNPDYITHQPHHLTLPRDLVILHGTKPLAEVDAQTLTLLFECIQRTIVTNDKL